MRIKADVAKRADQAAKKSETMLKIGNFALLRSGAPIERRSGTPYEKAMWFSEWGVDWFGLRARRHAQRRPQEWELIPWAEIEGVADTDLATVIGMVLQRDAKKLLEEMRIRSPRAWEVQQKVGSAGIVLATWAQDTVAEHRHLPEVRVISDHPRI